MPDYRLYFMNDGGHIEEAGEFQADDDATAIAAVNRARGNGRMELWCGTHKVMRWDPSPVYPSTVSA
jgi:hypothetical protein